MHFNNPKVGPCSTEERTRRLEFEKDLNIGKFSKATGWVVSLGEKLSTEGISKVDSFVADIQEYPYFQSEPRKTQGWALLLYFTYEVCISLLSKVMYW